MLRKFIIVLFLLAFSSCKNTPPLEPSLSALGSSPDWNSLENFQETLTREEFLRLLDKVYAPMQSWRPYVSISLNSAEIKKSLSSDETFTLRFAKSSQDKKNPIRYWRTNPISNPSKEKPLQGLKIAIDPGHIGGKWAQMERRWFRGKGTTVVQEGDLTLAVAKLLKEKLTALGAEVYLVRSDSNPVTPLRPEELQSIAKKYFEEKKNLHLESIETSPNTPEEKIKLISELLFYRVAEIRERAKKINDEFKPDLTLCIHFNAGSWGNPEKPHLSEQNHVHILINGAYTVDELALDDVRFEMLVKLLNGSHDIEKNLSEKIAASFAEKTGLPPPLFPGGFTTKVGKNAYVFARNLLANRLDQSPVVFLEPYIMNNPFVLNRIEAGQYNGLRKIDDEMIPNLFEEYASAVVEGILSYFSR